MISIWAKDALTHQGWQSHVTVTADEDGVICSVESDTPPSGTITGLLLPAPANLHSHAFQRAMAGMTEARGDDPKDNFWTWRKLMYRFLQHLTPDDIETITAFVQMEMLEAGFGTSAEFHYIHHQPDGSLYDNPAELSERVLAAAQQSGIGLTHLPVMYEQGGCDGRPLGANQKRFGHTVDQYATLLDCIESRLKDMPSDTVLGTAPHSLRAVSCETLEAITALRPGSPVHIHIAEQTGEIKEVEETYGQRPVDWLMSHHAVDKHWCLVHATHMNAAETESLARSGAVAGLCPITEANLGDGIFDGAIYLKAGGYFGIGSDSNVRISLQEELRLLEYSQRLKDRGRAVFASQNASSGRTLLSGAAIGGARAAGRNSGAIEPGRLADLLALDREHTDLVGKHEDMALDSFIFAGDKRMITDVWSGGRHLVVNGRHIRREIITAQYRDCLTRLMSRL